MLQKINSVFFWIIEFKKQKSNETFEAYLIGRKISNDLKKRVKYRGSQFKLKTFIDLIDDTEKRYKEFITTLEKQND